MANLGLLTPYTEPSAESGVLDSTWEHTAFFGLLLTEFLKVFL